MGCLAAAFPESDFRFHSANRVTVGAPATSVKVNGCINRSQTNNKMKTRTIVTPLLVAAGLLCATTFQASAQAGGGGGGGGGMGGMLTQDQRTKLRESMQGTEMTDLSTKLAAAQKEAVQAATAKTPDEKTVRAKVEAVTKIQTDIAMLRFKAFKEIASTLTDEQKTQMESRPGMAYMMVLGGGFGGGGGRRGGGGGAGGAGN